MWTVFVYICTGSVAGVVSTVVIFGFYKRLEIS